MKKILSIFLAAAMILSTLSFAALADEIIPGDDMYPFPECFVTELTGDDLELKSDEQLFEREDIVLDYALNFTAKDTVEDMLESPYKNYIADFELEFSEDVTAVLAGQYDNWDEKWVVLENLEMLNIPVNGIDFEANKPVKVVKEYGTAFMNQEKNLNFTYADCVNWVQSFNCGAKIVSEKDVDITLRLVLYETEVEVGAGPGGQNVYNLTGNYYIAGQKTYEHKGAVTIDTSKSEEEIVEDINALDFDRYTSDDTKNLVADAIKGISAEAAAKVDAEIIAEIAEDNGEFAVIPGTNTGLEINVTDVEDKTDYAMFNEGNVFDITATVNGEEREELDAPVLIKIPCETLGLTEGQKIEKIYHEHNGEISELNFTVKDGYVWISMYKFSLISIVIADVPAEGTAVLKFVAAPAEEGTAVFDLLLVGDSANTVRNLSAGEFVVTYNVNDKATNEADKAKFELIANNATDIYKEVDGDTVTYRFNLQNINVEDMWTAKDENIVNDSIKIATLVITGRDVKGTVTIDEKIDMEKSYIDGTGTQTAAITTAIGDAVNFEIAAPTRELTVKVDISAYRTQNQAPDFQAMTLVIDSADIEPITVNLGDGAEGVEWEDGVYTVVKAVPANSLYQVTLSAKGYRKAYYEIQMNFDKTLTFWNNHKPEATPKAMEEYYAAEGEKRADGKAVSNFLAGDIVDDNIINEFDLSAVVSYFGENTTNLTDAFSYIAYDINRDGKVDSKDVAIVLAGSGK